MSSSEHISFGEFGQNFMREVVTPARVADTIASVVGERIEVGPLSAGPADAATATLRAKLAGVDVESVGGDDGALRFSAVVRLECTLAVKAPVLDKRYRGTLTIPLRLSARTASPVRLVIEV